MTRFIQRPFIALFIPLLLTLFNLNAFAQSDIPDYASYQVITTEEFEDLFAAPANSAAYLAPSGDRFVHIERAQFCVYNRLVIPWLQSRCIEVEPRIGSAPTDIAISPDGAWITLPTFSQALQMLYDTDIQVLNLETGTIDNLTDDGYEGSSFREPFEGFVDLSPVWLSDRRLAFVRTAVNPDSKRETTEYLPSAIYTIDFAENGTPSEPRLLMTSPVQTPFSIYVLAADSLGSRIAFTIDTLDSEPELQGIWTLDIPTGSISWIDAIADSRQLPRGLAFSPDGRYLLTLRPDPRLDFNVHIAHVLDVKTGAFIDIDSSLGEEARVIAAGWSPRGSALVYIVRSEANPEREGVYITAQPGEPGQMILEGRYYATTCCETTPINWGANDVILIGRGAQPGILLIQVG